MTIDYTGSELKEKGMALATGKANRADPGWSDTAEQYLRKFLILWTCKDFTGEEAQQWMLGNGLGHPDSSNAWGGVFNRAAKRGLITKTGEYRSSQKPNAHCRMVPVWRKV